MLHTGKKLSYESDGLEYLDKVVIVLSAFWETSAPVRWSGISFSALQSALQASGLSHWLNNFIGHTSHSKSSKCCRVAFFPRYSRALLICQLLMPVCVSKGADRELYRETPMWCYTTEFCYFPLHASCVGKGCAHHHPQPWLPLRCPWRWVPTGVMLWPCPGNLPNCTGLMQSEKICLPWCTHTVGRVELLLQADLPVNVKGHLEMHFKHRN